MSIDVLKLVGFLAILLVLAIAYAVITVEFNIEDKSPVFPFIVIALMFLIVTILNKDSGPVYKLDKIVDVSSIKINDDKVYVDDLEIEKDQIYSLNFYRHDNYLIDYESFAYICPGIKLNSKHKILVVNKSVTNGILKDIEVLNINDSIDLHKFVSELNSSTTTKENYDKSISGILNNDVESSGKVQEENLEESLEESLEETENSNKSIDELKVRLSNLEEDLDNLANQDDKKANLEEKISTIEKEVKELKNNITKLEKEMTEIKNTKHQTKQLVINDASVRTIVASIIALILLGVFVYGRIIKINTNSKKELLFTASEAKIREGVMLDKDL